MALQHQRRFISLLALTRRTCRVDPCHGRSWLPRPAMRDKAFLAINFLPGGVVLIDVEHDCSTPAEALQVPAGQLR